MPPAYYDPTSPNEQPLPIPAEETINVIPGITLLPPRTRRGYGPGMIMFLPPLGLPTENCPTPLDPPPPTKWAEEGFAILAAIVDNGDDAASVKRVLEIGAKALLEREDVDVRDKIGILGM
jgi:carboxymethylenebutenolidase